MEILCGKNFEKLTWEENWKDKIESIEKAFELFL